MARPRGREPGQRAEPRTRPVRRSAARCVPPHRGARACCPRVVARRLARRGPARDRRARRRHKPDRRCRTRLRPVARGSAGSRRTHPRGGCAADSRVDAGHDHDGVPAVTYPREFAMATWLILLIAALVAAVIGFGTAAKWLFIVAVVLLLLGLFVGFNARRGAGTR